MTKACGDGNERIPAGITKTERFRNNRPVLGGLNDPRMGSVSRDSRCKTCECGYSGSGSNMDDCPGHFGHIELCQPVYHCGFIDQVVHILRCVCYHCSKLLADENVAADRDALHTSHDITRLRRLHDACRGNIL